MTADGRPQTAAKAGLGGLRRQPQERSQVSYGGRRSSVGGRFEIDTRRYQDKILFLLECLRPVMVQSGLELA
jgi:hypothetical protein